MLDLHEIAKDNGAKLMDMADGCPWNDWPPEEVEIQFRDRSHSAGDEIYLGLYSDPELRLVSFFHELGHVLDLARRRTKFTQERAAWQIGFAVAKRLNLKFSLAARRWCKLQLETYRGQP